MISASKLVAYVDIDDTLVSSAGRSVFLWLGLSLMSERSSRAASHCTYGVRAVPNMHARLPEKLGLEECFLGFLPKPNILIDDQAPSEWRRLIHVHPLEVVSKTADDYSAMLLK